MKITYHLDSLNIAGGISRIISLKANYFAEKGHEVTLISTIGNKNEKPFYPLSDKIKIVYPNIDLLEVFKYKRSFTGVIKIIIARIKNSYKNKQFITEYLKKNKIDFFIATFNEPFIARLKDGSKKIYEFHFSTGSSKYFLQTLSPYQRLLFRIFSSYKNSKFRLYDKIVILTEKDRQLRNYPKNSVVIPNAITIAIPNKTPDYSSKKVISVGRLDFPKGYDFLFKAWSIVNKYHNDWELNIYGHGYGRENEYQKLIEDLQLSNIINIHEPVSNITEKYLEHSFYVMSSRYEGFPLVLPEAMACGLSCVSYNCDCGPSDIISHGEDGLLVEEVGDIEGLAKSIIYMIEHPEQRESFGKKAKENIIAKYPFDKVMPKWEELLKEMKP